tara:strand:- start:450 stop:953 length:504 start_codon:yes stop_codon:yes gene_type:complete
MADENEWTFLGSTELGVAGNAIDVTGLAVKKLLQVLITTIPTGAAFVEIFLRFNNDTDSKYRRRTSINGGSDTTDGGAQTRLEFREDYDGAFIVADISNVNGEEKLIIGHQVYIDTVGAGNAPDRVELVGKYVPTALTTDIDEVNIDNTYGGNNFDVGSSVDVAGAD